MDILYTVFLTIHSILRWLVLLFGLFAIIRAWTGYSRRRPFEQMDNRAGMLYTMTLDTQVLVGLILYFFLSPITTAALQNFGGAMSNAPVRFFAIEHVLMMLVAVVLAHIGRALSRKGKDRKVQHRNAAIFYGLSLLVILLAIPWPFLAYGRPLI